MPQRSIRFSDRVLKEFDTVWRTRGFASPTAFIGYAVKQELSERQEGLTGAEERIAATLVQVRKDVYRVLGERSKRCLLTSIPCEGPTDLPAGAAGRCEAASRRMRQRALRQAD